MYLWGTTYVSPRYIACTSNLPVCTSEIHCMYLQPACLYLWDTLHVSQTCLYVPPRYNVCTSEVHCMYLKPACMYLRGTKYVSPRYIACTSNLPVCTSALPTGSKKVVTARANPVCNHLEQGNRQSSPYNEEDCTAPDALHFFLHGLGLAWKFVGQIFKNHFCPGYILLRQQFDIAIIGNGRIVQIGAKQYGGVFHAINHCI